MENNPSSSLAAPSPVRALRETPNVGPTANTNNNTQDVVGNEAKKQPPFTKAAAPSTTTHNPDRPQHRTLSVGSAPTITTTTTTTTTAPRDGLSRSVFLRRDNRARGVSDTTSATPGGSSSKGAFTSYVHSSSTSTSTSTTASVLPSSHGSLCNSITAVIVSHDHKGGEEDRSNHHHHHHHQQQQHQHQQRRLQEGPSEQASEQQPAPARLQTTTAGMMHHDPAVTSSGPIKDKHSSNGSSGDLSDATTTTTTNTANPTDATAASTADMCERFAPLNLHSRRRPSTSPSSSSPAPRASAPLPSATTAMQQQQPQQPRPPISPQRRQRGRAPRAFTNAPWLSRAAQDLQGVKPRRRSQSEPPPCKESLSAIPEALEEEEEGEEEAAQQVYEPPVRPSLKRAGSLSPTFTARGVGGPGCQRHLWRRGHGGGGGGGGLPARGTGSETNLLAGMRARSYSHDPKSCPRPARSSPLSSASSSRHSASPPSRSGPASATTTTTTANSSSSTNTPVLPPARGAAVRPRAATTTTTSTTTTSALIMGDDGVSTGGPAARTRSVSPSPLRQSSCLRTNLTLPTSPTSTSPMVPSSTGSGYGGDNTSPLLAATVSRTKAKAATKHSMKTTEGSPHRQ